MSSGHVVITHHDELPDAGTVEHDQLEELLQGIVPNDLPSNFTVGVPFLNGDNTFVGNNIFSGDLTVLGTRTEAAIANLNIDDVVITLGHGTGGELPAADRGLVMTGNGPNPSMVWDHSESEFRFGLFDVDTNVSEFPEPTAYASLRTGDIDAQSLNVNDISVVGVVATPEIRTDILKTSTGDDYLATHITPGGGIEISPIAPNSPTMIISRTPRVKEVMMLQFPTPAQTPVLVPGVENIEQIDSKLIDVFVNGVMVLEGQDFDYLISPNGIIFSFDLEKNDAVTVTIG